MESLIRVSGRHRKGHQPMKPIYITKSGKLGTAAQSHAWTSFGGASGMWGTLTDEQYEGWEEAAKKEKRRRRWPAGRRLTGQNLFTEINSHQAFLDRKSGAQGLRV